MPLPEDHVFCPKCGTPRVAAPGLPADPLRAALERALGVQYDVMRLLGRGGMGAVYLARDRALERLVAVKILPPEYAADTESRERFRREARTAANLTHPNIVPLHTFGEVEGMLYFVMGYVRGESLAERLRRERKLPVDTARRILRDIADALAHAHGHGIVHRDIKPDNILLEDETGRPMLTDFGVAKARTGEGTLTATGMVVGTPLYLSPEQASGARDVDGRSDLYSLGVLGYAMLAGQPPFEGEGFQDLIVQHISREPPPLEALAPDAPRELVAAVSRCLAKAPEERWPDAGSLAAAVGYWAPEDDDEPARFPLSAIDQGLAGDMALLSFSAVYAGAALVAGRIPAWGPDIRSLSLVLAGLGVASVIVFRGGAVALARRRGHDRSEIRRLYLRPPRWWRFWWPVGWRRAGDVWGRLPTVLRRNRILQTVGAGLLVPTAVTFAGLLLCEFFSKPLALPETALTVAAGLFTAEAVGASGIAIAAITQRERWGRRLGLTARESARAAERPTTDFAFWRNPKFAALLAPVGAPRPALAEPRSPQEFVASIGEAVRQLAHPLREVGRDAVGSARQLAAVIAALDAEIHQLARDADPEELAAVQRRLADLGEPSGDHDARRQMRTLLESQRDLLRVLAVRREDLTRRRARLLDLLTALWLQVANLRAQAAAETATDAELTGRIRSLCGEISAQAAALQELHAITTDGGPPGPPRHHP